MDKEFKFWNYNLVYLIIAITIWICMGLWIGWFATIMINIIGGAIYTLYLKLTGRI